MWDENLYIIGCEELSFMSLSIEVENVNHSILAHWSIGYKSVTWTGPDYDPYGKEWIRILCWVVSH